MSLLEGEIRLTVNIITGIALAECVMRLPLTEWLMARLTHRTNLPPVTCTAMLVSLGSSYGGASVISRALADGEITERCALWSVMLLAMPSYLHRWPQTLIFAASTAGTAGTITAVSTLARSVIRFMLSVYMIGGVKAETSLIPPKPCMRSHAMTCRKLIHTLAKAWITYALAHELAPVINRCMRTFLTGSILPASGWSVAAAGMMNAQTALVIAGGAMSAGELRTSEAVFAMTLGASLSAMPRIIRQDMTRTLTLFPKKLAVKMMVVNFVMTEMLMTVTLIFAGLALSL